MRCALSLQQLAHERGKPDAERENGYQQRDEDLLVSTLRQVRRRYAPSVEKQLLNTLLSRYQQLSPAQHLVAFGAAFGRTPAELSAPLDRVYAATKLGDEAQRLHWFKADPAVLAVSDDALLQLAAKLQPALQQIDDERKARDGDLLRLRPACMQALIAYRQQQGRAVYPDANSTLRVSYGKVTPLQVRDAGLAR